MNENHTIKTIITPLIGLTILVAIGYQTFWAIVGVMTNTGQCGGLWMLMCFFMALPIAATLAVLGEIIVTRLLLKKARVPHFTAIPIFTTITALSFWYVFASVIQEAIGQWIAFGLVYLLLFLFYYWYFAVVSGGFSSKVLRSIAGIGTILILGVLIYYYF